MLVKRWAFRVVAVVAVLVVAGAAWLALHQLPARTPPPLLWSEADLPLAPAPADNGWSLTRERALQLQDETLAGDLAAARASGDWDVARALTGRLGKEAESPGFRKSLDVLDRALALPRFADGCRASFDDSCEVVRLLGFGKVADVAIAKHAVGGEWESALGRLERVLRARLDHARTSRQVISGVVAAQQLEAALELTRWVFEGAAREKAALRRQRVEAIAALLNEPVETGAARRAVVADYLMTVSAIRMLAPRWRAPGAPLVPTGEERMQKLIVDGDHTLAIANAYYARVMAAVDGGGGTMPAYAYRRDFWWWAYNPAGKVLLEAAVSSGPHIEKLLDAHAKLQPLHEQARALVAEAAPKTLPPSSCDCVTGDLVWGREHQSGIFRRRSSIVACREYTTRARPGSPTEGKPPVECTQAFEGCDVQSELVRLLNRSDVWAGFEAAPAVYGADLSRGSAEPPLIVFHGGRKIRIGESCDGVSPSLAEADGCVPIPPAIAELRVALDALDRAETEREECAERWKALASGSR